jgi:hypothetical protein
MRFVVFFHLKTLLAAVITLALWGYINGIPQNTHTTYYTYGIPFEMVFVFSWEQSEGRELEVTDLITVGEINPKYKADKSGGMYISYWMYSPKKIAFNLVVGIFLAGCVAFWTERRIRVGRKNSSRGNERKMSA